MRSPSIYHLDDCDEMSGNMGGEEVLQENLVDPLHLVHPLLLPLESLPPEPLHPGDLVLVPRHQGQQQPQPQQDGQAGHLVLGGQRGGEAETEHDHHEDLHQVVDCQEHAQ